MKQNFIIAGFKSKKLITQLFTVLFSFSIILIVVTAFVVNYQTTNALIVNNNLIHSNALKISSQTLDALFFGYHDSLTHITYDASIIDFVITPKPNHSSPNFQVLSVLNGYCQENEAIEEIYLYVKKTEQVLTSTYETSDLDYFQEKNLIKNHTSAFHSTTLLKSGRTTSIEVYNNTIYLVRDFPLNGDKKLGSLFMKINPAALYNNTLSDSQTSYSFLLAYDNDWNPLFPDLIDYSLLPKEVEAALPDIKAAELDTTYIENQHYFFIYSEQSQINLVLSVNDSYFTPALQVIFKNLLPFFALILILSALLSICIFYLSCLPILKLTKLVLSDEEKPENKNSENEWDYLTERFLNISQKKFELNHAINSMIPQISKEFYFSLLNGKPMERSYIQTILTNINSPLTADGRFKTIGVTFLEAIDRSKRNTLMERLQVSLEDFSDGLYRYVMQQIDSSLHSILIQFEPDVTEYQITNFEIKLEQAFYKELAEDDDKAWIVFGSSFTSIQDISVSHFECLQNLVQCKYPFKAPAQTEELTPSTTSNHRYFEMCLKSISNFIMQGDITSALQRAQQICDTVFHDHQQEELYRACEHYRMAFLNLLTSYNISNTFHKEYSFVFDSPPYFTNDFREPALIKEFIEHFCIAAIHLLSEKYQKQQHKYLITAKKYVEDNYDNPDLSLHLLAEQCNTTTSYLSRLFKESFGINFVDYINQQRIEKAKELLITTKLSIKDIAQETGFNSQQNFIRVFKKHIGKTPGQYR